MIYQKIRNDLTLPRLNISATISHWALVAAEASKTLKYVELCNPANAEFAACAANPLGGFGPTVERHWHLIWTDTFTRAAAAGLPTRPVASLERRCLERIAALRRQRLRMNVHTLNEVFIRMERMNTRAKKGVHTDGAYEQLAKRGVHTVFIRCSYGAHIDQTPREPSPAKF